jgi:hypothetical protein
MPDQLWALTSSLPPLTKVFMKDDSNTMANRQKYFEVVESLIGGLLP